MKAPLALLAACLLLGAAGARAGSCPFAAGTLGQQPVSPNSEATGEKWKMPELSPPSSCTPEEYETIARELVTLAEVQRAQLGGTAAATARRAGGLAA